MEPLSLKTRRIYAIVSSIVFVIVLAFAILYASGYNLKGFSVIETGAIHIAVPGPDATVSLNGEEVGKSSFLARGLFLDNLAPGTYAIEARAPGYYPWVKNLVVTPTIVTEVSAFLMPVTFELERVPALRPLPPITATSTPEDAERGLALTVEDGTVRLRWTRSSETVPPAFCVAPGSCLLGMVLANDGASKAAFFNGGVVYQTTDGVYLTEADVKEPRLVVPVYPTPGATFRIERNRLFITHATSTYEVGEF